MKSSLLSLTLVLSLITPSLASYAEETLPPKEPKSGPPQTVETLSQPVLPSVGDFRTPMLADNIIAAIPVLMAVRSQSTVSVPAGFFGPNYKGDMPLSKVDVYRLSSYLIAKSNGFADYTRKKLFIVYRKAGKAEIPVPQKVEPPEEKPFVDSTAMTTPVEPTPAPALIGPEAPAPTITAYIPEDDIAVFQCDIKNPGSLHNRRHGSDCAPESGQGPVSLNQILGVYVKWHNGEIIADNLAKLVIGTSAVSAVALPIALKRY